jgi:hypothetical protein
MLDNQMEKDVSPAKMYCPKEDFRVTILARADQLRREAERFSELARMLPPILSDPAEHLLRDMYAAYLLEMR